MRIASVEFLSMTAGLLLLLGIFLTRFSRRFNLPALLIFLSVGCIAEYKMPNFTGTDWSAAIHFFSVVAMSYILYSGGMETDIAAVRKVAFRGILLAGPGVVLTALILGCCGYFLLHNFPKMAFPLPWYLLLGAVISSTDAAAVFAILRGNRAGLKGTLQPLLELESGSNDPMAAFLTILMLQFISGETGSGVLDLLLVFWKLGGGIAIGFGIAWFGKWIFRLKWDSQGLYFVISFALVLLCYGVSEHFFRANGFMTCYACGIGMGTMNYNYKKSLCKFHYGISWLMQASLFIALGFLAQPSRTGQVWQSGIVLSAVLMFLARPVSVFLCLIRSEYSFGERTLISWVGLRGAAPIVLATFPLAMKIDGAEKMFQLIFFMVIISLLLQGATLMPLARKLRIAKTGDAEMPPIPLELEITQEAGDQEMREFLVPPNWPHKGETLAQIGFKNVLVTMIRHDGRFSAPRGGTVIAAGDGLLVMANKEDMRKFADCYFPGEDEDV